MRELGLTFPIVIDDGSTARACNVINIPASFFIDADGIVRARYLGPMSRSVMDASLDAVLPKTPKCSMRCVYLWRSISMMPLTTIGPFALSSFGLAVLLAFWLSNGTVERMAKRVGVDAMVGDWLPLVLFLVGLVGARLWYVLFNRDLYTAQPRLIAQLSFSAFAFPGALLAGGSVLILYARATRRNLLPWLDILAQVLPWGQALGMLGLLLSGEGYGRPTSVPWRIHLLGVDRHPSQLYEALALVLLGLWVWRRAKHTTISGVSVARYLGGYGAIRLLLEPLRGDSLRLGSLRVAQVVELILILGSLRWMLSRSARAALSKPVTSE